MYNEVIANLAGGFSRAIGLGKPQLLLALQAMQYNMMLLWLVTL